MTIFSDDLLSKPFQNLLVGNVTYKMLTLLLVNHADIGTGFPELVGNALPDTLCATRYYGYFFFEFHNKLFDGSRCLCGVDNLFHHTYRLLYRA